MSSGPLWLSLTILGLASIGIASNLACFFILTLKKRSSMFHNLLKLLSVFDIVVILGCSFLYALPGIPWDYFSISIYPRYLPYILPLTQIAVMASVYCTTLMSFERYVRICHLCQLRHNTWLSQRTFGILVAFVIFFPVLFYIPRFFEVTSQEVHQKFRMVLDCSNFTEALKVRHLQNISATASEDTNFIKNNNGSNLVTAEFQSAVFEACSKVDFRQLEAQNMLMQKIKVVSMTQMETTWLRENKTYQFVYCSILNTMFATVMPVFLLFYLNLSTVSALSKMKKLQSDDMDLGSAATRRIQVGTRPPNRAPAKEEEILLTSSTSALNPTEGHNAGKHINNHKMRGSYDGTAKDPLKMEDEEENAIENEHSLIMPPSTADVANHLDVQSQVTSGQQTQNGPVSLPRQLSLPAARNSVVDHGNQHKTENRLTRISLAIVWLFLFCHVWKLIPTMYEVIQHQDEDTGKQDWPSWLQIISNVSHTLIVFNSAVNFLIYSVL